MNSRHVSIQGVDLDRLDRVVLLLQDEWSRHGDVELKHFWTEQQRNQSIGSVDSLGLLVEIIKADLRCRFDKGQTPTVTAYLDRFPELLGTDTRVLSLIYEEFCLSEERGHAPDVESFCRTLSGLEGLAGLAASVSSPDQHRGRIAAFASGLPQSRGRVRGVPPGVAIGDGRNLPSVPRERQFAGGKASCSEDLLGPRSGAEGSRAARSSAHRARQLGDVSTRGAAPRVVDAFRAGLPLDEIIKRVNPSARPRKAIALWHALVDGASDHVIPETADKPATLYRTSPLVARVRAATVGRDFPFAAALLKESPGS